jgi:hypothetical protein
MRAVRCLHLPLRYRWWHNFEAVHPETQERRSFFIQYLVINPGGNGTRSPVFGQLNTTTRSGRNLKPSYARLAAGTWGDGKVQLFNYYRLPAFRASQQTMRVRMGSNTANETALKGSVSGTPDKAQMHPEWLSDAGNISWDLTVDKALTFSTGIAGSPPFIKVGRQLHHQVFWQLLLARGMLVCCCRQVLLRVDAVAMASS